MVKFSMACLNNSVAEHILCIPLCVTCVVSVTGVGVRVDKATCNHDFRKTEPFICLNIVIALIPLLSLNFLLLKTVGLGYLCYRLDCLNL
jgi:hypothetical protein